MLYFKVAKYVRPLAIALAVLIWLSWIAAAPIYVLE